MNVTKILWDKHFAKYVQTHKNDEKDMFRLTNEAINYAMGKLGLEGKMPVADRNAEKMKETL